MSYHKVDNVKNKPEKAISWQKSGHARSKSQKKTPKKITPSYLHNSGLYYLERFSASKSHFKEVMIRKVKRSCLCHKDQDYNACTKMVGELADKFEACGLLNDKTYANALVSTMRRKGLSRRAIQIKMRSKGIGSDLALCSLEDLDSHSHETSEDAEFSAALTLARKKKIGAFSCGKEQNIQKSFGVLARAGFSYDIAKRVLNISLEELENDPYN